MKIDWESPLFIVSAFVCFVYALSIAAIMIQLGGATSITWWVTAILFLAWCVAPITVPLFFRSWIITAGVAAVAVWGTREYNLHLFGPSARSTSPLAIIFLPIYQWIAVLAIVGMNWVIRRIVRQ